MDPEQVSLCRINTYCTTITTDFKLSWSQRFDGLQMVTLIHQLGFIKWKYMDTSLGISPTNCPDFRDWKKLQYRHLASRCFSNFNCQFQCWCPSFDVRQVSSACSVPKTRLPGARQWMVVSGDLDTPERDRKVCLQSGMCAQPLCGLLLSWCLGGEHGTRKTIEIK